MANRSRFLLIPAALAGLWMVVAGLTLLMMLQRSVHSHTAAWLQLQLQKSGDKLKVDKVTSWLRVTVWK